MKTFCIDEKPRPAPQIRFKRVRRWLAGRLVSLANKISPRDPAVEQFFFDSTLEMMITGRTIVRVCDKEHIFYEQLQTPMHSEFLVALLEKTRPEKEKAGEA